MEYIEPFYLPRIAVYKKHSMIRARVVTSNAFESNTRMFLYFFHSSNQKR